MLLVSIFLLCAASSFAKDFGKDSVDNEKCKSNPYKIPNIYANAIWFVVKLLTKMQRNKNQHFWVNQNIRQ